MLKMNLGLTGIVDSLIVSLQASLSMAPVNIFKHGADEERAETARLVGSFICGSGFSFTSSSCRFR